MEEFDFDPETGLFSGWDAEKETYDAHSWHYETDHEEPWDTSESGTYAWSVKPGVPAFDKPVLTVPKKDATLQHERCVYQKFKEHYSATTWIPFAVFAAWTREDLELVYSLGLPLVLLARRAPFCMHWVRPSIRMALRILALCRFLQLLSGNIGVPGGGVCALRGEPNVQGATDMGMLVNEQPAYLKWSNTTDRDTLAHWLSSQTYSDGYYTNKPKFMISQLKEWFGENATVENDYGYDWWPKVPNHDGSDWSRDVLLREDEGRHHEGLLHAWGMNPCHSAPNSGNVRRSMANLRLGCSC